MIKLINSNNTKKYQWGEGTFLLTVVVILFSFIIGFKPVYAYNYHKYEADEIYHKSFKGNIGGHACYSITRDKKSFGKYFDGILITPCYFDFEGYETYQNSDFIYLMDLLRDNSNIIYHKYPHSYPMVRISNNDKYIILRQGDYLVATDSTGNELESILCSNTTYDSDGQLVSFDYWHKYDVGNPTPPEPEIIRIKPDYSVIKSAVDTLVNNQITTMNSAVLSVKDYAMYFSYSDFELKSFIENATYSDLTTQFSSYYEGINFNYMPSPSSTYSTTISDDSDMTNYINSISNNCASQINYLSTYGKAFINSYNNKYHYMQSMKTTDLKRLLAYCINSNSSTLGKCIYIYKDLVGVHSKIYLPSNYVSTAFREYKHYDGNTWYSLQDGQLEVLECIQYNLPSNIGDLNVR